MPTLNTEVVNLFLEQFSRELPAGVHAVLIWDGAGFHTGEDVVVPSNVSLIQLPLYSPELNPVENLWHYLRAHHWSNRRYRDYDALQEEAVRSLCAVREDIETIKTVCNYTYIKGEKCGRRQLSLHYDLFAGRIIRKLGGRSVDWPYRAIERSLARKLASSLGRLDYVRVRVVGEKVEPMAIGEASILSSTTRADGFVLVPADLEGYPAGATVTVWLYDL